MPIYAYRCSACGHAKDVLQKMSDPVLSVCPSCGAEAFTKQVTAAGFQLKGSGWYVTDFRGGSSSAPAADKDGAKAGGSSDAGGSAGSGGSGGDSGASSAAGGASAGAPAGASAGASTGAAPAAASGGTAAASASASAGGCGSSCACH